MRTRVLFRSLSRRWNQTHCTLAPLSGMGPPLEQDSVEFARLTAAKPPSEITASEAGRAADSLRTSFVERPGGVAEEFAVPIHLLMRIVATYERWVVPTAVAPTEVRTVADLITGTVQETGAPVLLAYPDVDAMAAHAGDLGVTDSLIISAHELLESWQRSQQVIPCPVAARNPNASK